MTPEKRVESVMRSVYGSRWDDCQDQATVGAAFVQQIQLAVREAVTAERERVISLIRKYLLFNSQRAVSWHEVQDAIAAIREGRPCP
jgi:hypothetical protein